MFFFQKKKNRDSQASVLSETEIQKKLYGEFASENTVVENEPDSFKTVVVNRPGTSPHQKKSEPTIVAKAGPDLFNTPQAGLTSAGEIPSKSADQTQIIDHVKKQVISHDFEKKKVMVPPSRPSEVFSKKTFFFHPDKKNQTSPKMATDWAGRTVTLLNIFFDPASKTVRQFLLWGSALLLVALLFWGVSALNTQREDAMRGKYNLPAAAQMPQATPEVDLAQRSSSPVPASSLSAKPEREVVMTPVVPKRTNALNAASPSPRGSRPYVIQVVTYPSSEDAQRIVDALKRENLKAFLKENIRPSGRTFYVVMIGEFRTEAEAQAYLVKFRAREIARPFQDAFVKSIA